MVSTRRSSATKLKFTGVPYGSKRAARKPPKRKAKQNLGNAPVQKPLQKPVKRCAPPATVDIISKYIPEGCKEAKTWARNARESPLLRLPAELRMKIYEYVLGGGNTIRIEQVMLDCGTAGELGLTPTFAWGCSVFPPGTDHYNITPNHMPCGVQAARSFTLLNGVCRQLYKETATLPYILNKWADDYVLSWSVLYQYSFVEKRLPPPQRRAIRTLFSARSSNQIISSSKDLESIGIQSQHIMAFIFSNYQSLS
ncbi:hypothetical protein CC78DRAFT_621388 [Lojkania enalia]|uniref:Uncharacterized protein n=1 Tax=Lojkania enalia TaxID=147567 RepID=A0A9P4K053_9PLEO|nr:hypothetical protein CC78DRAFT_621388 [Didymosphaeria enalia]